METFRASIVRIAVRQLDSYNLQKMSKCPMGYLGVLGEADEWLGNMLLCGLLLLLCL